LIQNIKLIKEFYVHEVNDVHHISEEVLNNLDLHVKTYLNAHSIGFEYEERHFPV
jgi:hypothetical protein